MEPLTPEELDGFKIHDTLSADELTTLRRRAEVEPATWIVTPGSARYGDDLMEPVSLSFLHRPTGKDYTFAYAKANATWFRQV